MTKEWHASKEGLAWHSEHGKAVWNKQKEYIKSQTCKHCGKSYTVVQSRHEWSKFCSNTCKSAYRKASGVDDICRVCLICGSTFLINKYSKTKFCSKACVTVHRKNAEYAK